ncbi:MAG: PAS domain S-box protein [Chloroflexota bacterium]
MSIGMRAATQNLADSRNRFIRLWNFLTDPSTNITQYEERRRAKMLATILLILLVILTLVAIVSRVLADETLFTRTVLVFFVLSGAYFLNRSSYTSQAAVIVLMVSIAIPVTGFLTDPKQVFALTLLVNSIFFCSVYFSGRVTGILLIFEIGLLLVLAAIRPEIHAIYLIVLIFFLLTESVVVALIAAFRWQDSAYQKAQARLIADSELRYRLLAENATDFICRHSLEGAFLFASPAGHSLLGYEPDELLGQSPYDFIHPDDIATVRASHEHVLATTQTDLVVYRFRRKDGSYIWFESTSKVIRDPQTGTPWEIVTVSRDISRRKQIEVGLQESEERFRAASEASMDAFYLFRSERDESATITDFIFISVNARALQLIGNKTREEVIGQRLCELLPINRTDGFFDSYVKVVETGIPLVEEFSIQVGSDNRIIWLQHQVVPVLDGVAITTRNINERKQSEENLRQTNLRLEASRDTLQRLIQQMPIGVQVFDTNGLCTDVNQAYMEIFGVHSRDQVIGQFNILEHMANNQAGKDLKSAFSSAAAGEIVHLGESVLDFSLANPVFTSRTGKLFLSVSFCPIYDENQKIINVVALNRDITERKWIEENLRQTNLRLEASRDTLRRLIQQMPIGIQEFDTSGLCTSINETHMAIFGLANPEQVIGKFNILADRMAQKVGTQEGYKRALAGEIAHVGEVEFDFKQADPRFTALTGEHFLSVSFFPIFDENQTIVGVVALNQDITERKLAEKSLKQLAGELLQQKNTLNAIVSATPDQLAIFDRESRYLYINPSGLATLGASMADVQDKTWRELGGPPEIGEKFDRELAQVFATGQLLTSSNKFPSVIGTRDYEYALSPVLDSEGQVVLAVLTNRDVTEHRQAEQERFALALERERVKMLQHLISDTSHDLKTPLATLNTSLYLLKKTISDPERREHYTEVLQAQVVNLTKILEDMDSMARLDGASDEFVFESVDLNELLRQIVTEHETLASEKNQRLGFNTGDAIPPLSVDTTKLRRAITNLVTNALNYTPENGEILTRIYRNEGNAVIEIRDNGMGIAPNELALIFDRFYRSEASRKNYSNGSGLGLAITKKIVEGHGGTIQVESEIGVGSIFRIVLPVTFT